MRRARTEKLGRGIGWAALIAIPALLLASGAYGQSGSGTRQVPCIVNYLRLRIATGGDDLRGWDGMSTSHDNLNVTIYFGKQGSQLAADVNKDQVWQSSSMHLVEIKLNQAVPLEQIRGIKLEHTGSSGPSYDAAKGSTPLGPAVGIQSPDTWDMQSLEVTAVGESAGATILQHGPKIFTNGDRVLSTRVQIPANSCEVGERFGRLNLADKMLQKSGGAGSKYGQEPAHSTIQVAPRVSPQQLQNNRLIKQALAHTVQIGPRAGAPGGNNSYSAIIAIIKRQSLASRSLVTSSVRPPNQNRMPIGGSGGASQSGTLINPGTNSSLNPQPLPPKGSQPHIGASQTMSAPGNGSSAAKAASSTPAGNTNNFNLAPQGNSLTPTNGPTPHQAPGGRQPLPLGTRAPAPLTTICRSGIATVAGAANGVWFSPVAGQDGQFVIQGCGFGNAPGEVYLSGVQYDPAHAKLMVQHLGVSSSPDRVYFQTPANGWSDRQIVAQIDANAGGLYDTNNVTLNVKTTSGQIYQAIGMNFLAAREDQPLSWIVPPPSGHYSFVSLTSPVSSPTAVIHLTTVMDSSGNQMVATFESPSASTTWQNETVDVIRAKLGESTSSKVTFLGGTDIYQLNLAPGFELDPNRGVEMRHTQIDVAQCQTSFNGEYSSTGNWSISYASTKSFQVSWQEQACWPKAGTQGANPLDFGSVSAYALQITVIGPRGVNPFASGNGNGLAIKQLQPVQMLPKN